MSIPPDLLGFSPYSFNKYELQEFKLLIEDIRELLEVEKELAQLHKQEELRK
jgi:hypothetical protein